ncbi:MAG: UDP-glucose/GDP-mannose dehydrogenase family protein [Pseudomonadota bacterium]
MKVAIVGTGYVGLVSGACFADFGHTVVCVDKDQSKIEMLERGEIPIFEPGLDALVAENVQAGRLSFTDDLQIASEDAEAIFIAVGTPSRRGDGFADLSYVYAASEEIAKTITDYTVVVTKSTVPVGTGGEVEAIIRRINPDADFSVVSNPEFLREGAAIDDFKRPDRVVVGAEEERARDIMRELYRPLFINETPILFTNRTTSELIKYAANAFLATKITFINEMADICEQVGGDVQEVARGIGLDKRIGSKFLHAGPGYGGSCFPKDTQTLVQMAEQAGAPTKIVEAVVDINNKRKTNLINRVLKACGGDLKNKTIALLGLTFKPNTDDMRDAPSLDLVPALQKAGAHVKSFDPAGMDEARKLLSEIEYCHGPYDTMDGADAVVLLTEWDEFRALDFKRVKDLLRAPIFVDLRNVYPPVMMREEGFEYHSIGR